MSSAAQPLGGVARGLLGALRITGPLPGAGQLLPGLRQPGLQSAQLRFQPLHLLVALPFGPGGGAGGPLRGGQHSLRRRELPLPVPLGLLPLPVPFGPLPLGPLPLGPLPFGLLPFGLLPPPPGALLPGLLAPPRRPGRDRLQVRPPG